MKKKGAQGFKRRDERDKPKKFDSKRRNFVDKNSRQSGPKKYENPQKNPNNLRVTGLGTHIKGREIKDLFESIAPVEFAIMIVNSRGEKNGKAVVKFRDPKFNRKAIQEYNNAELDNKKITVEIDN